MQKSFNIRVYGLLFNEVGDVLISDEFRFGHNFTKFPGGGLEWGEGTNQALMREFEEELNVVVEVGELVYVNDFFQVSRFAPHQQLLSFYYRVFCKDLGKITISKTYEKLTSDGEKFRWISKNEINPAIFTFPIDQEVAKLLMIR